MSANSESSKGTSTGSPPAARGTTERSQRRNRGRRASGHQDESQQRPSTQKFVGKEDGLADEFVYQLTSGSEASDQYTRTTDEIIRYSSTKYKQGGDVERSLSDGTKLVIQVPPAPQGDDEGNPPPDTDVQVWKMRVNMALQRDALLDANLESAYALIKGQCSKPILEKYHCAPTSRPHWFAGAHQVSYVPIQLQEISGSGDHRADWTSAGGQLTSHPGMVEDELRAENIVVTAATAAERAAAALRAAGRFEAALF